MTMGFDERLRKTISAEKCRWNTNTSTRYSKLKDGWNPS